MFLEREVPLWRSPSKGLSGIKGGESVSQTGDLGFSQELPVTSTLWGHGRGDTAEVAVLPSELTPSPSHSLGSGAHPKRWVLLAPDHSTLLPPATQVQGVVSGETSGKVPRACRAAPPFPERGRKAPASGDKASIPTLPGLKLQFTL